MNIYSCSIISFFFFCLFVSIYLSLSLCSTGSDPEGRKICIIQDIQPKAKHTHTHTHTLTFASEQAKYT